MSKEMDILGKEINTWGNKTVHGHALKLGISQCDIYTQSNSSRGQSGNMHTWNRSDGDIGDLAAYVPCK